MPSRQPPENVSVSTCRNSYLKSTLLLAAGLFLIGFPALKLQEILAVISNFTLR